MFIAPKIAQSLVDSFGGREAIVTVLDDILQQVAEHGTEAKDWCPYNKQSPSKSSCNKSDSEVPSYLHNKFTLNLSMSFYEPSDITVKFNQNSLVIDAKREKTVDGIYEFRKFVKMFPVSDIVVSEKLQCKLGRDGVLRIEAPLKDSPKSATDDQTIPIQFVDCPQD